ncbi:MAG: hypothetical protein R2698_03745 [Microthrixaceae bacterium]
MRCRSRSGPSGAIAPLVAAATVVLSLWLSVPLPAGAQSTGGGPTTTVETGPPAAPHIVPQPNSGHEPRYSGDTGSGAQLLTLVGILVAIGLVILGVWIDSRRKRTRRDT